MAAILLKTSNLKIKIGAFFAVLVDYFLLHRRKQVFLNPTFLERTISFYTATFFLLKSTSPVGETGASWTGSKSLVLLI